jgi:glycerol-3-phosphate cytidylyltransferase-like family protein
VDTRTKVKTALAGADVMRPAPGEWVVVTGYFDPVLAEHAESLAAIKQDRKLCVVVLDSNDALMEARARAEVLAGLAVTDLVLLPPESSVDAWLDRLAGGRIVRHEQQDEQMRAQLIHHVHARHALAAKG